MKRCSHASSSGPTGLLLSRNSISGLCPGHQTRVLPTLSQRSGRGEDEEPETHHVYRLPDSLNWHSDSPMDALDDVASVRSYLATHTCVRIRSIVSQYSVI